VGRKDPFPHDNLGRTVSRWGRRLHFWESKREEETGAGSAGFEDLFPLKSNAGARGRRKKT